MSKIEIEELCKHIEGVLKDRPDDIIIDARWLRALLDHIYKLEEK